MGRISIILFFLLLIFSGSAVNAQQDTSGVNYIREFNEVFHFKLIGQFRPMAIRIRDEESRKSLMYRPNSRPSVGVGGQILDIGFSFIFRIPESIWQDPKIYGDTRFHDFQFNFFQPAFAIDFQYQFYEGFYVSTVDLPNFNYNEYLQKPDLQIEGYGLNGVYIFNEDRFSYAAAFNNASKQLHSVGSFILVSSIKHTRLRTNGTLVPEKLQNNYNSLPGFRRGEFTGFAIMPGYAQTFVVKDFYLNIGFAAGPDLQYKDYTTAEATKYDWTVEGKIDYRAGLGYDNGKFFTGLIYVGRRNLYSIEDTDIVYDSGFVRLSVGHRFQETSWMQDVRNWKLYKKVMNPF